MSKPVISGKLVVSYHFRPHMRKKGAFSGNSCAILYPPNGEFILTQLHRADGPFKQLKC